MAASSPIQPEFFEPDWTVGYALSRVQTLRRRRGAGCVFVAGDGTEVAYTYEELEVAVWERARHLLGQPVQVGLAVTELLHCCLRGDQELVGGGQRLVSSSQRCGVVGIDGVQGCLRRLHLRLGQLGRLGGSFGQCDGCLNRAGQ